MDAEKWWAVFVLAALAAAGVLSAIRLDGPRYYAALSSVAGAIGGDLFVLRKIGSNGRYCDEIMYLALGVFAGLAVLLTTYGLKVMPMNKEATAPLKNRWWGAVMLLFAFVGGHMFAATASKQADWSALECVTCSIIPGPELSDRCTR